MCKMKRLRLWLVIGLGLVGCSQSDDAEVTKVNAEAAAAQAEADAAEADAAKAEDNIFVSGDVSKYLTQNKYDQIKTGMTLKDVVALLGIEEEPMNKNLTPAEASLDPKGHQITWMEGGITSDTPRSITVKLKGNVVVEKSQKGLK